MKLTFTIPCYRSEHTVVNVIDEICAKMTERPDYDYEILAVNDCSPDDTWKVLQQKAKICDHLKCINFAKNRGKHAGLLACYHHATGDIVINVDDDGQCPVDQLWVLLKPILEDNYDISIAQYPERKTTKLKRFGSEFNNYIVRTLIGKPKGIVFSNFIARRKFVCDKIKEYPNPFPYLEGLTLQVTENIAMVPMEQRERQYGTSGYNLKRSIKLLLNGCTAFSLTPLRIAFVFGFASFIAAALTIVITIISMFAGSGSNGLLCLVLTMMFILFGFLFLLLGLLGEYVGRIYLSINRLPQFSIKEMINFETTEE